MSLFSSAFSDAFGPRTDLVVGGRFKLIEPLRPSQLASQVWTAFDEQDQRNVVLYFFVGFVGLSESDKQALERLLLRTKEISEEHAALPRVLAFACDDNLGPWLAYEWAEGETLEQYLREKGQLPYEEVVRLAKSLADILDTLHRKSQVHGELKPSRILILMKNSTLDIRLLELAFPRPQFDAETSTSDGAVMSSPHYRSPELLSTRPSMFQTTDPEADRWALAVILYRMAAGVGPFGLGSSAEIAVRIATEPARPLTSILTHANPLVDAFFEKAFHRDPAQRFATATAMIEAFERAWHGQPWATTSTTSKTLSPKNKHFLRVVLLLAIAVFLLLAILLLLVRKH